MGPGGGGGGAFVAGFICGILIVLPIVLLIISVIIRCAVWLTNKCLGGSNAGRYYDDDWDDYDDYDRPPRRRGRRGGDAVPTPEIPKGMGIALVVIIVNVIVSIPIRIAFGVGAMGVNNPAGGIAMILMLQAVNFVVGFLIWASVLTPMLPTTFGRACLVTVFILLIAIAITIVIVVPFVLLAAVAGR